MADVSRMISRRATRDKSAIGAPPPGKRRTGSITHARRVRVREELELLSP
jgi:hypothetical protein